MDYTQISTEDASHMLATIGVESIDDFFTNVGEEYHLKKLLDIPMGISEPELLADIADLAGRNKPAADGEMVCFLGGGVYDHFSPTVVDHLATQSEFLTAYTPYQAEASQGALQAFYEYQTMISTLTGMEVANASLYEQASAVAEAVLMAGAITKRNKVLFASEAVHPDTRQVIRTLTYEQPVEPIRLPARDGLVDLDALADALDETVASVVIQSPNFFGLIERVADVVKLAHDVGALVIQSVDPISCSLLKRPGQLDVDIAVGEGQSLGIPMSYGGPFLGFFACREKYLRKMPGRIVGMGKDANGKRGFCLALQTREQHIKRERATSNVCTNQGLLALRAAVHMAAMGRTGLRKQAELCFDKAHYAANRIQSLDGYELKFDGPFFREFVVQAKHNVGKLLDHCRSRNILAGVPLGQWFDGMDDCFLLAVTEKRTKDEIDALAEALETV